MYTRLTCLLLVLIVSACSLDFTTSNEQALAEALIDEEYFRSLAICEQIRLFATINPENIDRGHMEKVVPNWVDDAIDENPGAEIVKCAVEEGYRRLGLLERMPENRKEISLSIHALVLKAYNLDLLGYPQIQGLLDQVVCESNTLFKEDLGTLYYLEKHGIPDYYLEENAITRMNADICAEVEQ